MASNTGLKKALFLGIGWLVMSANGFSIGQESTSRPQALMAARIQEDNIEVPRWTELPRSRTRVSRLPSIEITTGRIAMVGFVGLLVGELKSGESFGQQIVDAVTSVAVN